jgi:hypothetical protein
MKTDAEKRLDVTPLSFGQYRGKTPMQVAQIDPSYIVWMKANVLDKPTCSRDLALECENRCEPDEEERWARSERGYGRN